ncbi:hypothetical protein [Erysipelothrix anatis]|uniref:hypothetical protein n=1 Tax=Erysipelothrix anatis TaxID=2683713 RepID=UPI0013579667|nr:hypothetical protein [Erysipelothrix anatis]
MKHCTHCGSDIKITEYDASFALVKISPQETGNVLHPEALMIEPDAFFPVRPYLCNKCGHLDLFGYNPEVKE